MKDLDALLQKYKNLTENHSISFDRCTCQEDLAGLRKGILMHVGLLTAFNTSLMATVCRNSGTARANISRYRPPPQRISCIFELDSSFALRIGPNSKEAWKDLCREQHDSGVTAEMLEAKREDIDTKNAYGQSAIHAAAENGRTDLFKLLLDKGATIDATTGHNWNIEATVGYNLTGIHIAARKSYLEVVKVLLDKGAAIDATTNGQFDCASYGRQQRTFGSRKVLLDKAQLLVPRQTAI
ncbi:ankyrin repeat-containing domain protein [Terfezia claveryi]|nr:ankyrin repeat-containing domain protein [Terfezia claveryi]